MSAEVLRFLLHSNSEIAAAIVLLALARRPVRAVAGARVAYALWLRVPALLVAAWLPAPSPLLQVTAVQMPVQIRSVLAADFGAARPDGAVLGDLAVGLWFLGALAMVIALVARQRSFRRSLGTLRRDDDGLHRSADVAAPMLVGAWRPRVVVPVDFEVRYSADERELVLAHERAHQARGDVGINAVASFALCLCWFNPLAYRALAWLRMDQELACDALVLSKHGHARRRYADALLKTQLATEAAWRQPIGCHWQSVHPLKERISMLKRPLPGSTRRFIGLAGIATLTAAASYATWAGQPADTDRRILVDLKTTVTNTQTNVVTALAKQYRVRSGEQIADRSGPPLDIACTPHLADAAGEESAALRELKAQTGIVPRPGQIFVECEISRAGVGGEHPKLLVADGVWGTIESTEKEGPHRYRIEIRASTSAADIAAAKKLE
jgi:beta-lactamase regulating signal transducer with metallopeptidase domain